MLVGPESGPSAHPGTSGLGPGWDVGAPNSRVANWPLQVGSLGLEWSATQRATQEAVDQELAALRRAWEQGRDRTQPHGPHRLVRSEVGVQGGPGLQAAEVIGALRSQEACLETTLRRLQGHCRQELARLARTLPGLIWIPPPGR